MWTSRDRPGNGPNRWRPALALGAALLAAPATAQHHAPAAPQSAHHGTSAADSMPKIAPTRVLTVTGDENWDDLTAFGRESAFVAMMNLMMVGGSGYENMRMEPVKPEDGAARHATADPDEPMGYMNSRLGAGDRMVNGAPSVGGAAEQPEEHAHPAPAAPVAAAAPKPAPPVMEPAPEERAKPAEAAHPLERIAPTREAASGVTATVATPKVGKNVVDIRLADASGGPLAGAEITAEVNMTNMDMGTTRPTVKEIAPGRYGTTATFSMRGPWRITLKVTPKTGSPFSKAFDFRVK